MAISTDFFPFLFLFYKLELEFSSIPTNISFLGSLQWLQDWFSMVNLRTFTSLTYLTQIAFLGGNAQTNSSQLMDIVPKREVLYVGGQYTNITASLNFY
jgi:hypothetical protein